jgi:KaiC/GvpD/RAD55 family RecA-like ATPase
MPKDLIIGKTNVTSLLRKKYKALKTTGWVTMIQVPNDKSLELSEETLKLMVNELGYLCIYITLGKSANELQKLYSKSGVDTNKVYYIDAISQLYGEKTKVKNSEYVSGPLDIDSVSISLRSLISKLGGVKKCVFLDSVTTVLLYNSLSRTIRFSQFLTQTLKKMDVTGVLVNVVKGEATKKLTIELAKLCDEVIDIK